MLSWGLDNPAWMLSPGCGVVMVTHCPGPCLCIPAMAPGCPASPLDVLELLFPTCVTEGVTEGKDGRAVLL